MLFARNQEEGEWMWGEHKLPRLHGYTHAPPPLATFTYTCVDENGKALQA